jgi:hypothetical protein
MSNKLNGIIIGALGVLVMGLPSAFWLASAADPAAAVRIIGKDVLLKKDSDLVTGLVPARTTITRLFDNHLIQNGDAQLLVSSIASAMDVRKMRAGQAYIIDRLLDGRVRRFEYEIDDDRRLTVQRVSADGVARFIAAVENIPKQVSVVTIEGSINREINSLAAAIDMAGERI